MSRIDTLTAALDKQAAAIKRLLSAPSSPKRDAALKTDMGSYMAYVAELAHLAKAGETHAPTGPTGPPVDVQWTSEPWPRPTDASRDAILARYGITAQDGQISVNTGQLDQFSPEDLQTLSATGILGNPISPVAGADYSRFSGVVGESTGTGQTLHVYRDGQEIASRDYVHGDNPDSVALWNEVTQS